MSGKNFRVQLLRIILMNSMNRHQGCFAAKSKLARWCGCAESTVKDRVRVCRDEGLIRTLRRKEVGKREATAILRLTERGWWYLMLHCRSTMVRRFESKVALKVAEWRKNNCLGIRPVPRIAMSADAFAVRELKERALMRLNRIRAAEKSRWGIDRGFAAVWDRLRAIVTGDKRMRTKYAPMALKQMRPRDGRNGPELIWSLDRYFSHVERQYMPVVREYWLRHLPGYSMPVLVADDSRER